MNLHLTSTSTPVTSTIYTIVMETEEWLRKYKLEKREQPFTVDVWRWWSGPHPEDLEEIGMTADALKAQCITVIEASK
jgi:hypothetical protein